MTAQKSEDETKTVFFIYLFIYLFVTTLSKASIFFIYFLLISNLGELETVTKNISN